MANKGICKNTILLLKKFATVGAIDTLNPPNTIKNLPWYFLKNVLFKAKENGTFFRNLFI